ncbi:MAG TPA: hypothetical protein PLF25_00375 [Accumulibacter sp.]|jgi:hypothetical protein|nr:hypothetical protein [Accumulibacter sp.]
MEITKTMDKKLESSVVLTEEPQDSPLSDQRRRRLIRGAVAFAPLVLTLRSGALAAASCTGARIVNIPSDGVIPNATSTDVCAPTAAICPDHPLIDQTKVLTQPTTLINMEANGTGWGCKTQTGTFYTGNMAVLSSTSATSMLGG